jgi:type IV pilus assembly protein PilB
MWTPSPKTQSISSEVTAALKETSQAQGKQIDSLSALSREVIREAPIAKIVETILAFAVQARASDVHIEPLEDRTRVRYRIDGILAEKLVLPRNVHDALVSRVKILSELKIDEKRVPQDGRFTFTANGQAVDLRVSTLPTVHGEKIVMRLLQKNLSVPSLTDLGLRGLALKNMEESVRVPHGIILITGPTGSGKTTTLYSILHKINTPKVNIVTLEDPVEYQMPGINQVQINPQAGLTFASGLRSFLRQDPNIIMVGEIRDSETAELAVQASLTGHLVFSTLHTNSAAGALPRLIDMGAEPFLLASSITVCASQRVCCRLNQSFKEKYTAEPEVVEDIKQVLGPLFNSWCAQQKVDPNGPVELYRPVANRPDNEPEYKGRIAIFEVLKMTEEIGKMVIERRPAADIEAIGLKSGMLLMKQDGYLKALEGITTLEEVMRVAEV